MSSNAFDTTQVQPEKQEPLHSIIKPDESSPQGRSTPTLGPRREENPFVRFREVTQDYAAEFFGTMTLVIFGIGANCQTVLSNNPNVASLPAGDWASLSLGWGAGLALGVLISGGGHINPAVTLALSAWRGFPLRKVPGYILSQFLGALVGAAIIFGNYFHAIDIVEGGSGIRTMKTAGLFGTVPAPFMSSASCFFSEFLGTAMLLFVILAVTDKKNNVPSSLVPVVLFITLMAISACLGFETGFALNPARDFGPRVLTSMVGYGRQVYNLRNQYWLWGPVIATTLGAQVAAILYDVFLYSGEDSLIRQRLLRHRPRGVMGGAPDAMV